MQKLLVSTKDSRRYSITQKRLNAVQALGLFYLSVSAIIWTFWYASDNIGDVECLKYEVINIYSIWNKKQRGQKRKLKRLLKRIDEFKPYQNTSVVFEHFHVPCSDIFINSRRTSSRIKTEFCKKWIEVTEQYISQKPKSLLFCKVVAVISVPNFWDSQIIIFYTEDYYKTFWDRATPEQTWENTPVGMMSFARDRNIETNLKEVGYIQEIREDDYNYRNFLWFYGEL